MRNHEQSEPRATKVLSVGQITGGVSPSTSRWDEALTRVTKRIAVARVGVASPLKVNVIFQVPGHILKPDFEGVRTGHFSKRDSALIVQVALPEEVPSDVDGYLKQAMLEAIREAELWAKKKGVTSDLHSLRALAETL